MTGKYTATFLFRHGNTMFTLDLTNHDEGENFVQADAELLGEILNSDLLFLEERKDKE